MCDGGEQQNSPPFHLLSEHETEVLRLLAKQRTQPKSQVAHYQPADAAKPLASYEQEAADHNRLKAVMDATSAYPINAVVKPRLSPMVNLKSPTAGLRAIRHRNSIFEVRLEVPLKPR
jgi:hypothetical protein